ncbi:MAG TPA: carboxypeptidase regulatory-like domain-containing protein [Egibacteraceae bacterium]|nr:carboxypeptidase regulatory-like domain-containing protein [Egibacteraceae bacterium]
MAVAGLTLALLLAGAVAGAPPAEAFGSSEPPPLPSVSAGGYMTCGLTEDGRAVCWGENNALAGDPDTAEGISTPPEDVRFTVVNAGYATGCGVTTARAVVCWGNDRFSQVSEVPADEYTHVVPGRNAVCALRVDQSIACWGGDAADPQQRVVTDAPTEGAYTQVTIGNRHACALSVGQEVVCWGANGDGQIDVPAGTYSYVNVSNFSSCALRTDGTAVCWGRNQGDQQTVPEGTFTQISTGFAHVCGLRPDGTITCWGRNLEAQATPPAGTFTHVSAGTFHSCAMPTAGPPAMCWGANTTAPSANMGRVQPNLSATPPPAGTVGAPYSHQLAMTTHVSPPPAFTVTDGDLPAGVTLSPEGLLSGTPTEAGSYTFTVAASSLGMSPPDCPLGATGTQSCSPGDPTSVATATRVFTIEVAAGEEPGEGPTITYVWNNHFQTVTDGLFVGWSEPISPQFPETGMGPAGYTVHEQPDCSDEAIAEGVEGFWSGVRTFQRELVMDGWENVTYGGTYYLRVAAGTELGTESERPNDLVACRAFEAVLSPDHRSAFAGQVTDAASGAAVAGATVSVIRTEGAPGTVAGQATTDAQGNYIIDHLAPGPYRLTVEAPGYEPASQDVRARRTETVTVDVALVAEVEEPPPPPANPTTRDDCKNGGWQDYGFRNQGQCIQFVNTGKDSRP